MSLTYAISDSEISPSPDRGKITGDATPATLHLGVITKLAQNSDGLKTDLEASAADFDTHDHDGSGGPPIGTGGEESISPGAITTAKIRDLAITGAKIASGAVTTAKIDDNTIALAKLGACRTSGTIAVSSGGTTFTHGLGYYPVFSAEWVGALDANAEFLTAYHSSVNAIRLGGVDCNARVLYWGAP